MDFPNLHYPSLRAFMGRVRALHAEPDEIFNSRLRAVLFEKQNDELFKTELQAFVSVVFDHAFFVNAFTDCGIHSNRGFFTEVYSRLKHKILPSHVPDNELSVFIRYTFPQPKDAQWIRKINEENWSLFFGMIVTTTLAGHSEKIATQLHNAIIILCHRLTTIGIDPYFVNKLNTADDSDSPFFELNHAVSLFVKKHLHDKTLEVDYDELRAVHAVIDTCEKILAEVQEKKDETGTSLHLTFILKRGQQHIDRIRLLLNLYITRQYSGRMAASSRLITELVQAEHEKNSVRKFIAENSALLAYRIVSHTSEKGEHYIGFSKAENRKLLLSSMGGGLVVVLLVYIKHWIHGLHVSLFFEGLLFGLNYGFGFVCMHLVHFSLATKQPAMTASYIAESIESHDSRKAPPWQVFRQIITSQFLSLVGNLIIVLPLCFLSAVAIRYFLGEPVFHDKEAYASMISNHPFYSASLIYAGFTGVFLTLSSLLTGYVDNKVVFSEIPKRIMLHPVLRHRWSLEKRKKLAGFAERNLGAILGNLFLGFCLGMAGNLGKFIGIPFDIRHITISAGNFGIATGSSDQLGWPLIVTVFAGVLLIGIINIISSFLISFGVACRSRNLSPAQSLRILLPFLQKRK